jgi:putative transposase
VGLTALGDVATRSVTVAVIRPSTKAVDAAVLLARSVTPTPMWPGWAQALAMSASVLPPPRLLELDVRPEHVAARLDTPEASPPDLETDPSPLLRG